MELQNIRQRFHQHFLTLDGRDFYGFIQALPTTERGTAFDLFRRLMYVADNCEVKVGDLMYDQRRAVFLLADHGDDVTAKTFKLIPMNTQASWTSTVTTKNPLTGLDNDAVDGAPVQIWALKELSASVVEPSNMTTTVWRYTTNAPIQVRDRIDGFVVHNVDALLGVNVALVS